MVQLAGLNFGTEDASMVYSMLETAETVAVILDFVFSNPVHHSVGLV